MTTNEHFHPFALADNIKSSVIVISLGGITYQPHHQPNLLLDKFTYSP